jgi:hypothetical protein
MDKCTHRSCWRILGGRDLGKCGRDLGKAYKNCISYFCGRGCSKSLAIDKERQWQQTWSLDACQGRHNKTYDVKNRELDV